MVPSPFSGSQNARTGMDRPSAARVLGREEEEGRRMMAREKAYRAQLIAPERATRVPEARVTLPHASELAAPAHAAARLTTSGVLRKWEVSSESGGGA